MAHHGIAWHTMAQHARHAHMHAGALRSILVVLYTVTAFAKLNDGWLDPHHSCAVQLAVASTAGLMGDVLPAYDTPRDTRRERKLLAFLGYSRERKLVALLCCALT